MRLSLRLLLQLSPQFVDGAVFCTQLVCELILLTFRGLHRPCIAIVLFSQLRFEFSHALLVLCNLGCMLLSELSSLFRQQLLSVTGLLFRLLQQLLDLQRLRLFFCVYRIKASEGLFEIALAILQLLLQYTELFLLLTLYILQLIYFLAGLLQRLFRSLALLHQGRHVIT